MLKSMYTRGIVKLAAVQKCPGRMLGDEAILKEKTTIIAKKFKKNPQTPESRGEK